MWNNYVLVKEVFKFFKEKKGASTSLLYKNLLSPLWLRVGGSARLV
jgi:hypothetical protein